MTLVNLPKGTKVYVDGKCWKGQIPQDICPVKYLPKTGKATAKSKAD
jgi:hypothetical protein